MPLAKGSCPVHPDVGLSFWRCGDGRRLVVACWNNQCIWLDAATVDAETRVPMGRYQALIPGTDTEIAGGRSGPATHEEVAARGWDAYIDRELELDLKRPSELVFGKFNCCMNFVAFYRFHDRKTIALYCDECNLIWPVPSDRSICSSDGVVLGWRTRPARLEEVVAAGWKDAISSEAERDAYYRRLNPPH